LTCTPGRRKFDLKRSFDIINLWEKASFSFRIQETVRKIEKSIYLG
jgi:hypothetical protein